MLELPHVMVGATIATLIPNPIISLPLALASHFITDYIPHWNPHLGTEKEKHGKYSNRSLAIVATDASLALLIGTYLAARQLPDVPHFLTILFACFLAVSPDVVEIPHFFFGKRIKVIEKLIIFQKSHQWNVPPMWGILSQVAVIGVCLYLTLSA